MSQHDYDLANQAGAAFRTDLNNALLAIVGQNSGATAPATTFAYMLWADTTTGLLKQRNAANSAWITIGLLSNLWAAPGTIGSTTPNTGAFTTLSASSDAGIAATQKLYLDGVALNGDTYISETSANVLQIYAGGGQGLIALATGGGVVSAQKLYFDGGGDTYLQESSANNLDVVAGGVVHATFASSGIAGAVIATQAMQETATSVINIVTPGRQQFHPSALKTWLKCDSAGNINASYNVTGITDTGTGLLAVTWATDFSSAHYAVTATAVSGSQHFVTANSLAAGTCDFICWRSDTAALADPTSYCIQASGDQ